MNNISFLKMHGLGNDFVIVSNENITKFIKSKAGTEIEVAELAKKMSNRRLGVGADQFIIYERDTDGNGNIVNMQIFNQDGTAAEACGNASRCLVKIMHQIYGIDHFTIKVRDRVLDAEYVDNNIYRVNMGKVDLGKQILTENENIMKIAARFGISAKEIFYAEIGNPHLVIFSKLQDKDQKIIGQEFQNAGCFAEGVNVNFAQIDGNEINLRVFERGAGFTLACGSGACATFACANYAGFVQDKIKINFKLGSLMIETDSAQNIIMQGPATMVYQGQFVYE